MFYVKLRYFLYSGQPCDFSHFIWHIDIMKATHHIRLTIPFWEECNQQSFHSSSVTKRQKFALCLPVSISLFPLAPLPGIVRFRLPLPCIAGALSRICTQVWEFHHWSFDSTYAYTPHLGGLGNVCPRELFQVPNLSDTFSCRTRFHSRFTSIDS